MAWLIIIAVVFLVGHFWLAAIATVSLRRTDDLDKLQKVFQFAFAWLVPYFGPVLVLKLLNEHDEEAIPKKWVPNDKINQYVRDLLEIGAKVQGKLAGSAIEHEVVETISDGLSGSGGGD